MNTDLAAAYAYALECDNRPRFMEALHDAVLGVLEGRFVIHDYTSLARMAYVRRELNEIRDAKLSRNKYPTPINLNQPTNLEKAAWLEQAVSQLSPAQRDTIQALIDGDGLQVKRKAWRTYVRGVQSLRKMVDSSNSPTPQVI